MLGSRSAATTAVDAMAAATAAVEAPEPLRAGARVSPEVAVYGRFTGAGCLITEADKEAGRLLIVPT